MDIRTFRRAEAIVDEYINLTRFAEVLKCANVVLTCCNQSEGVTAEINLDRYSAEELEKTDWLYPPSEIINEFLRVVQQRLTVLETLFADTQDSKYFGIGNNASPDEKMIANCYLQEYARAKTDLYYRNTFTYGGGTTPDELRSTKGM